MAADKKTPKTVHLEIFFGPSYFEAALEIGQNHTHSSQSAGVNKRELWFKLNKSKFQHTGYLTLKCAK